MNSLILSLATLGGVAAALPAMTAGANAPPIAQTIPQHAAQRPDTGHRPSRPPHPRPGR